MKQIVKFNSIMMKYHVVGKVPLILLKFSNIDLFEGFIVFVFC